MTRAALAVCALVACVLTACGPPDGAAIKTVFDPCSPVVLVPQTGASDAQRASVVEAMALWHALANTAYTVDDVADAPHVPIRFDAAAGNFHGFYDDHTGTVFINRALADDRERAITIAHEVGHSLGLVHVPPEQRKSLMNPGNIAIEPNEGDRASLVRLWGECPVIPSSST